MPGHQRERVELRYLIPVAPERRRTIVMVTHDPMAASYADRIIFLADGRIVDEAEHTKKRLQPGRDRDPRREPDERGDDTEPTS